LYRLADERACLRQSKVSSAGLMIYDTAFYFFDMHLAHFCYHGRFIPFLARYDRPAPRSEWVLREFEKQVEVGFQLDDIIYIQLLQLFRKLNHLGSIVL
jgi:hypothetical protein